ncbi:MAG: adenylyltransferase/cytidyltransferase family protein [bacterium]|nr:adenylyltransferase/cytidyltransferase family protein [bacterium]
MKKIAFLGGTFNPPHNGHVKIGRRLTEEFDDVVVMPCGPGREKPSADMVDPIYLATMCDMAFGAIPKVRVDLSDLERDSFTRTHALVKRFSKEGEVWVVIGSDLLQPKDGAKSEIHTWEKGEWLWNNVGFVVVERPDYPVGLQNLPRLVKVFPKISNLSSSSMRQRIFNRESIKGFVPPRIEKYIQRHRLYTGRPPSIEGKLMKLDNPRALIFADDYNIEALRAAEGLRHLEDLNDPDFVLMLGGDGTAFRAIRRDWRKRLPFFGVNLGHEGFLLNKKKFLENYDFKQMNVWQVPLLNVRIKDVNGNWERTVAFNDVWMERDGGHMARIRVLVNGKIHEEHLRCDSVLVSTAAGSTAYAMRLGVTPMYWFIPSLAMAASAVWDPPYQRSWNLDMASKIKLKALETERAPVRVFVDGVKYENVLEVRTRVSRIAAVELAFHPEHDVTERVQNIHQILKEGK